MRRIHILQLRPRLRWLTGRPAGRDERGSLIVVLTVIMVVVMLSSLLLVRVVGNQGIVSGRQAAYSGVSNADAGLSDVLFRLDQPNDIPSSGMMCLNALNSSDTKCSIQSSAATPQLSGISYVARTVPAGTPPASANTWTVQAIGSARSGMKGAVQETLTRSALYPFALFGKKSLSFSGDTTSSNFGTFQPGPNSSTNFTSCSNTPTTPPCLEIGSDGAISCSGTSPASIQSVYYNTGSGGGGTSCGTSQSQSTTYNVPDPTPPPAPSGVTYSCPNNGNLGSGFSYPSISPGVYVCTSEVSISGTLTVSPNTSPVQLYIMPSSSANTVNSTFLYVAQDSQINTTITYAEMTATPPGPSASDTLPNSTLFQVFTNSVGNLDVNGTHGFVYGGILYAPEATLTTNGCKSFFFGAAIINTYNCNGGPNLGFYYDSALSQYFGNWQVADFEQINPASVCIPDTANNC